MPNTIYPKNQAYTYQILLKYVFQAEN